VGLVWALCWLILAAATGMPDPVLAIAACMLALAVFAFGETLWSPVAPALLNDLAPEHLRGRYNSFQSLLWGVSGALGPLVVGLLLSRSMGVEWTLVLAAGCTVAALLALRLGRYLTPGEEGPGGQLPADPDPDLTPSLP
jgi:MFS family permease